MKFHQTHTHSYTLCGCTVQVLNGCLSGSVADSFTYNSKHEAFVAFTHIAAMTPVEIPAWMKEGDLLQQFS